MCHSCRDHSQKSLSRDADNEEAQLRKPLGLPQERQSMTMLQTEHLPQQVDLIWLEQRWMIPQKRCMLLGPRKLHSRAWCGRATRGAPAALRANHALQ